MTIVAVKNLIYFHSSSLYYNHFVSRSIISIFHLPATLHICLVVFQIYYHILQFSIYFTVPSGCVPSVCHKLRLALL